MSDIDTMLAHSRKRLNQRSKKPIAKHAGETMKAPVAASRVEDCIDGVMRRFPGLKDSIQHLYFEAVHQELAPLARDLECELAASQERVKGLEDVIHRDSVEMCSLCAARDEARRTSEYWKAEHLTGNARVKALEDALRPFIAKARHVHPTVLESVKFAFPLHAATVADLRRAAALLEKS